MNIDKTVLINSAAQINELAVPLKNYFKINYFGYIKTYHDLSHVALSTSPEWMKNFYKKFHNKAICHKDISSYKSSYFLWSQYANSPSVLAAKDFDIAHGIILINKQEDFCEFFGFATAVNNYGIENWYLQNMDLLERFIFYFKEKGLTLIKKAEQDRYILPNQQKENTTPVVFNFKNESEIKNNFINATKIKKYYLSNKISKHEHKNIYLTEKEMQCAILLVKGFTSKEIAKILFTSPRTIEVHLDHIKQKLNARNLIELTSILTSNYFTFREF